MSTRAWLLASLLLVPAASAAAQQSDSLRHAYDLERRGSFADAAALYRGVLAAHPAESAALFGLERTLLALNRAPDILPEARAAIAGMPGTGAFYGVAIRAWAAAGQMDSIRTTALAWASAVPDEEAPYREWGAAALARHDRAEARRAYRAGRERLRRPDALAPELARLAVEDSDWATAVREWVTATARAPAYRATAATALAGAPDAVRAGLLHRLRDTDAPAARWIEADLRARWGDPLGGYQILAGALPDDRGQAADALRVFLGELRDTPGQAAARARGLALEALAARAEDGERERLKLEAVRAFTAAGDQAGAERMAGQLAADSSGSPGAASDAAGAVVGLLLGKGNVEGAERKLATLKDTLPGDRYLALRRRVAWAWVRTGRLDRADSTLGADTTVDGLALAGRLRLLHGDVRGAVERLAAAGPYAGTREEATQRTALLALLQPIEADSLPALGRALLGLERGDTARAIAGLTDAAGGLPPAKGGAALRLYAGTIARAAGNDADAERLFRAADIAEAEATAPAAELALGRLLLDLNRAPEAVKVLEQLILAHPQSALVPAARRALDEARGGVPPT
ncbi:MAG TPA: hypothetical protein VFW66_15015 [Gemmatimonadales bacterium]|nr:hypothetical protein [Gemmatimonadales bacterium]